VLTLEWWLLIVAFLGLSLVIHPTVVILRNVPGGGLIEPITLGQLRNPLFLIPLLMLVTTLGVAYLVAGQASPPVHQRRWWSRLLIAAMHIAQPVERGFARYQTRFKTISIPETLQRLREVWERKAGALLGRSEIALWSEEGVGREAVLEKLLAYVGDQGWFPRVDSGWAPKDVRFYGDRFCKADLTTVTENHGGGRRLTRLRLKVKPTLFHDALLILLAYLSILAYAWSPATVYAVVPGLVLVGIALVSSRRTLGRTVMATILATAETLRMSVVGAPTPQPAPAPADPPASEEPVAAARRAL
jgi:hypothetical protein